MGWTPDDQEGVSDSKAWSGAKEKCPAAERGVT